MVSGKVCKINYYLDLVEVHNFAGCGIRRETAQVALI